MSQAQTAAAMDRLPWLPDDPAPVQPQRKRSGKRELVGWAIVAVLLVAAVSYWMGSRSWRQPAQRESVQRGGTVTVPQPRTAEPPQPEQPQVTFKPAPEVSPVPVREVPIARPRVDKRSVARRPRSQLKRESPSTVEIDRIVADQEGISQPAKAAPQAAKPAPNPDAKPLTAWPASQSQGAKGRIVRIGASAVVRGRSRLGATWFVPIRPLSASRRRSSPIATHAAGISIDFRSARPRRHTPKYYVSGWTRLISAAPSSASRGNPKASNDDRQPSV